MFNVIAWYLDFYLSFFFYSSHSWWIEPSFVESLNPKQPWPCLRSMTRRTTTCHTRSATLSTATLRPILPTTSNSVPVSGVFSIASCIYLCMMIYVYIYGNCKTLVLCKINKWHIIYLWLWYDYRTVYQVFYPRNHFRLVCENIYVMKYKFRKFDTLLYIR